MRAALIPAHNEEDRIAPVILRASRFVDVVLVCDDGSTDLTAEIAKRLGAEVISHERNLGYGAALKTLFKEAIRRNIDYAVTLDADGQHDPTFIPKLLEPLERGEADLVVGSRFIKGGKAEGISFLRRLAIRFLNWMNQLSSGLELTDTQSGMRAYNRKALEVAAKAMEGDMAVSLDILREAKAEGLRIAEVPITVRYHGARPSRHPVRHFLDLVSFLLRTVLEERPIMYLGVPGLLILLAGLYFGWFTLSLYLDTKYFSLPMAFLAVATSLTGFFLIISSFHLYAIARTRQEISRLLEEISRKDEGRPA